MESLSEEARIVAEELADGKQRSFLMGSTYEDNIVLDVNKAGTGFALDELHIVTNGESENNYGREYDEDGDEDSEDSEDGDEGSEDDDEDSEDEDSEVDDDEEDDDMSEDEDSDSDDESEIHDDHDGPSDDDSDDENQPPYKKN